MCVCTLCCTYVYTVGHRGQFNWSDYLASSGAVAAPEKLFENEKVSKLPGIEVTGGPRRKFNVYVVIIVIVKVISARTLNTQLCIY